MPDISFPEIFVLVILAVIIFGPNKLPDLARKAARVLRYVRGIANDARGQLAEQLGPDFADLASVNPRAIGRSLLGPDVGGVLTDARQTFTDAGQTFADAGHTAQDARQAVQAAVVDAKAGASAKSAAGAAPGAVAGVARVVDGVVRAPDVLPDEVPDFVSHAAPDFVSDEVPADVETAAAWTLRPTPAPFDNEAT